MSKERMWFTNVGDKEGRVIGVQQPSWKKWVKEVDKGFNAVPSKVTTMELYKWVQKHWLLTW